jgi:hypothetical protein
LATNSDEGLPGSDEEQHFEQQAFVGNKNSKQGILSKKADLFS